MKKLILALTAILISLSTTPTTAAPTLTLTENIVIIEGVIRENMLKASNTLLEMTKQEPPLIDIIINSPGGSVFDGLQFINAMEIAKSRGITLRCTVTTMAASMAYQILLHCDERYAFRYTTLLWHPIRIRTRDIITPRAAYDIWYSLHRIQKSLLAELLDAMDIGSYSSLSRKKFYYHFRVETLHIAEQLEKEVPHFLTIISDVKFMYATSKLHQIRKPHKDNVRSNTRSHKKKKDTEIPPGEIWYISKRGIELWNGRN